MIIGIQSLRELTFTYHYDKVKCSLMIVYRWPETIWQRMIFNVQTLRELLS